MAAPYKYDITARAVMEWANGELEHVGRIAGCADPNIQYSYALSTVNGMAHLKDALFELVNNPDYADKKTDLLHLHDAVIRVMKHIIKDYDVDISTIKAFNTKGVLSDLSYLGNAKSAKVNSAKANSAKVNSAKTMKSMNTTNSMNLSANTSVNSANVAVNTPGVTAANNLITGNLNAVSPMSFKSKKSKTLKKNSKSLNKF